MDFTAMRVVGEEKVDAAALRRLREQSVHSISPIQRAPQVLVVEELEGGIVALTAKLADTLEAKLAHGGHLLTLPHEVSIDTFLMISERIAFVGSVTKQYVKAMVDMLEKALTASLTPLEIPGTALSRILESHTVSLYEAAFENKYGERNVLHRRADIASLSLSDHPELRSITIIPKVISQVPFILTVKSKGLVHANCQTVADLLEVFRLIAGVVSD